MTNPILEEIFDPAEYPPNLIREGATIQREAWIAFRDFLTTNYGIYMYPFNEGSGETFSGESLPDGVLSGIKTYRKETNIPKAPYALMMDEGSYARVTDTSFDGLTGDAAFAALIYLDGDRDASGAKSAASSAVLIDKASEWRLSTVMRYRDLTGVRYYTTTNAQSSTGNYALQLRYPQFVVMRRNAAAKTIDIFINGIKQSTVTTTGVGTDASNTNPQYFGSIGGTAAMLEGWQSTVWPIQEVTLSDQDILDIAVELGVATTSFPYKLDIMTDGVGTLAADHASISPYAPNTKTVSGGTLTGATVSGGSSNIFAWYFNQSPHGSLKSSMTLNKAYRFAGHLWTNGTAFQPIIRRGYTQTPLGSISNTLPLKFEVIGTIEGTDSGTLQYLIAQQGYAVGQEAKAALWTIQEVDTAVMSIPVVDSSGGTSVGNTLALTLNDWGTIYGGGTLTYQWYRDNGAAISGATSATYTLQGADSGHYVSCVIKSVIDGEPYFAHTVRVSIP